MEQLLTYTLFGSVWVLGIIALAFIIGLFFLEHYGKPISTIFAIALFIGLLYFKGNVPLDKVFSLTYLGCYLGVGLLFAILRTFIKGRQLKSKKEKDAFQLKYHVFNWWFIWPISLLKWIFGDLVGDLYNMLYGFVEKIFMKIFYYNTEEEPVPIIKEDRQEKLKE